MKIWLFSDLHMHDYLTAWRYASWSGIPDADVCVVAGDLIEGDPVAGIELLDELIAPFMPVVYVLGNHELHSDNRHMWRSRVLARTAAQRTDWRVRCLDDGAVTIGGVRFLGTTLWTDFQLFGDDPEDAAYAMNAAAGSVLDYQRIHTATGPWTPDAARAEHASSVRWLERCLQGTKEPVVVVSHHAPAMGSLHPEHERDLASASYVSRLEPLIERYRPAAWLHGHTHHSFDYHVGATRVVCNPKGIGNENRRFDPVLVIEVAPNANP